MKENYVIIGEKDFKSFWIRRAEGAWTMGMSNMEVKKANQKSVLRYILRAETETKNSIAAALGLSVPTVTQCLRTLAEKGLVCESGTMESIGGRKAMGYECVKNAKYALGVDMTPNHINIAVIDLAMRVVMFKRLNMRLYDTEQSYAKLKRCIEQQLSDSGIASEKVLGMGVSLPAIIDDTGEKILDMHEKMRISRELYSIIGSWFAFPVRLGNDANCAASAEIKRRDEREDVIYFFISQSVGGAIVNRGLIDQGFSHRAGEFGHMTLHPGGQKCYCGRQGCANAYLSTTLLAECAGGYLDRFFENLGAVPKYRALWNEYLSNLTLAIHNLMNIFDRRIIIGGYLGEYIRPYLDLLKNRLTERDPYLEGEEFLEAAVLKYEAAAMGAANIFIEAYLDRLRQPDI